MLLRLKLQRLLKLRGVHLGEVNIADQSGWPGNGNIGEFNVARLYESSDSAAGICGTLRQAKLTKLNT